MLRLSSFVLLLGAMFSAVSGAIAQCVAIPGTGCPGAPPIFCLGAPQLGQLAQVSYAVPGELVIASLGLDGPPWVLPQPLACAAGCVLAGQPVLYAFGVGAAQLLFLVPNNPIYLGFSLIGQGFYIPQAGGGCFMASNALRGTIIL